MLFNPLTQITKGYAVQWNELALSIEGHQHYWTFRVKGPGNARLLYEGHRGNVEAAKIAAIEFAMARVNGKISHDNPEKLARALPWREY
jgi:hypothetical protein